MLRGETSTATLTTQGSARTTIANTKTSTTTDFTSTHVTATSTTTTTFASEPRCTDGSTYKGTNFEWQVSRGHDITKNSDYDARGAIHFVSVYVCIDYCDNFDTSSYVGCSAQYERTGEQGCTCFYYYTGTPTAYCVSGVGAANPDLDSAIIVGNATSS